jgi:crossover junction endodeoxyribonuclease RusA
MIEITLPWPPKGLSPNCRMHWAAKSKITKAYRQECRVITTNTLFPTRPDLGKGKIHLFVDFCPPDKRARDDDNVFASFKGGKDGIADALGIDDKRFISHPFLSEQVVKGGEVRVRITQIGMESSAP